MNKKWRYLISTLLSVLGFFLFLWLPVESRYYGMLFELGLVWFCFWFGLGVIFDKDIGSKFMVVLLPVLFTLGYGLFVALLAGSYLQIALFTIVFGVVIYLLFLVENVFLVAIGYKTVPLYRAAYTVSLIIVLFCAFFAFDTLFSFRFPFWVNALISGLVAIILSLYQFWAIAIDLPDDGKEKGRWVYVLVSAWIMAQMALVFSFWPVGIFKGSIYLVSVIYILSGLYQADIRQRLFKGTVNGYLLVSIAIVSAIILTNRWG